MKTNADLNNNKTEFFAHSKPGKEKQEWQPLIEHLNNTAKIALELGKDAGLSDMAWAAAYLHDIGKYSMAFQRRLQGMGRTVDHSTAGAKEIMNLAGDKSSRSVAELISYCITGHHSGLPDHGSELDTKDESTLIARLKKKQLEDYSAFKKEIDLSKISLRPRPIKSIKKYPGFSISFLIRILFSILVDADWIETETFVNEGILKRGEHESIAELCDKFNQFLSGFNKKDSPINRKRSEILAQCLQKASSAQGIYTLTVPTGGGKTISSMAFALNHARQHDLKRIIYVIPYTSIIEQNAAVFKEALGTENVLEHHSNFDWEKVTNPTDSETDNITDKIKLAAENWDIPIIVTTNVQFFESLFANDKTRARKLHNIVKSVIIFDEAQMLPREYLRPCMCAVQELVQNYSATAIFCTATQPTLKRFFPDLPDFDEIASNPIELADFFKRVNIQYVGILPDAKLIEELNSTSQALCIVNTRRHAKVLFHQIQGDHVFHLSTLMCPVHRKQTLDEVQKRLKNEEECHLISTQVMEAGVDIDFPVGYRAMAGLDSILQAGGRVNREGQLKTASLYVFEPETIHIKRTPTFIRQMADVARMMIEEGNNPNSLAAIKKYYHNLFDLQDEDKGFDAWQIMRCFEQYQDLNFQFKTASANFHLIDNFTKPIIIPFDEKGSMQINELRFTANPMPVIRKLQNYTINLYEAEYEGLMEGGALELIDGKYAVLKDMKFYDPASGIQLPEKVSGKAIFV